MVIGGAENTCRSELGVIVGGNDNMTVAAGPGATITSGRSNTATAWMSSIGGGLKRKVSGEFDWQAGSLSEDQ